MSNNSLINKVTNSIINEDKSLEEALDAHKATISKKSYKVIHIILTCITGLISVLSVILGVLSVLGINPLNWTW